MKIKKILLEWPKCDTETKWVSCWKKWASLHLHAEIATNLHFLAKCNIWEALKVKHNKTSCTPYLEKIKSKEGHYLSYSRKRSTSKEKLNFEFSYLQLLKSSRSDWSFPLLSVLFWICGDPAKSPQVHSSCHHNHCNKLCINAYAQWHGRMQHPMALNPEGNVSLWEMNSWDKPGATESMTSGSKELTKPDLIDTTSIGSGNIWDSQCPKSDEPFLFFPATYLSNWCYPSAPLHNTVPRLHQGWKMMSSYIQALRHHCLLAEEYKAKWSEFPGPTLLDSFPVTLY